VDAAGELLEQLPDWVHAEQGIQVEDGVLIPSPDASLSDLEALLLRLEQEGITAEPLQEGTSSSLAAGLGGLSTTPQAPAPPGIGQLRIDDMDPALTTRDAMQALSAPDLPTETFAWLNDTLAATWKQEAPALTFQQYKLHLCTLGEIPARDWGMLHIQAAALPETPQHTVPVDLRWTDEAGQPCRLQRRIALDRLPASPDSVRARLAQEGWDTAALSVTIGDGAQTIPAAADALTALDDVPAGTLRALLSDTAGNLQDSDGAPIDLADPAVLADLQDATVPLLRNTVLADTFLRWSQESAAAIRQLLSPLPDTAALFVHPSRSATFPGKGAPLITANAALCGLGAGARAGIGQLLASPQTRPLAQELDALLQHAPMDQDSLAAIDDVLGQLLASADRPLQVAVRAVQRLVDRLLRQLTLQADEHGPFFEMTFSVPHVPSARGLEPGERVVRLRPEDLQAFHQEAQSPDPIAGGLAGLADFSSGPGSFAGLAGQPTLGPGLVTAGADKALRASGSRHGLFYKTSPEVVTGMLTGQRTQSFYLPLGPSAPEPSRMLGLLRHARHKGGAVSVTHGQDAREARADAILEWGCPHISGKAVPVQTLQMCLSAQESVAEAGRQALLKQLQGTPQQRTLAAVPKGALGRWLRAVVSFDTAGPGFTPDSAVLVADGRDGPRLMPLTDLPPMLSGLTVTTAR
jgi:hypothetical protein